jgi:hypothetical protein
MHESQRGLQREGVRSGEFFEPFADGIHFAAGPKIGEWQSKQRRHSYIGLIRAVLSPEKHVVDALSPYVVWPDVHPDLLSIQVDEPPKFMRRDNITCIAIIQGEEYTSSYLDIVQGMTPEIQHLRFWRFQDRNGIEVPARVPYEKNSVPSLTAARVQVAIAVP